MDSAVQTIQELDVKMLVAIAFLIFAACIFIGKVMNMGFSQIASRLDRMDHRLDGMQETITDIDRRLCRLEGAFQSKDCCMLNSDSTSKKSRAE